MTLDSSDKVRQFINDIVLGTNSSRQIDMQISPCSNGYINYVWRVKFTHPLSGHLISGHFRSTNPMIHAQFYTCSSLIVKSANSFVRANPMMQISSARLDFEADALQSIQHCLQTNQRDLGVQVAQLYYYNKPSKTILLEDLGEDLVEITDWLHHFTQPLSSPQAIHLDVSGALFGSRIGQFLRVLHTNVTNAKSNDHTHDFFKVTLYSICCSWFQRAGCSTEKMNHLTDRMMSVFKDLFGKTCQEPSFIVGDLRVSAWLLKLGSLDKLSLIDFEFSGIANRLVDIADMSIYLWTQSISYRAHAPFYDNALQSFYESYFDTKGNWQVILTLERERLLSTHMAARLCTFVLLSDEHCAPDCLYRSKFGDKSMETRLSSELCVCKKALADQAMSLVDGTCKLADIFPFLAC